MRAENRFLGNHLTKSACFRHLESLYAFRSVSKAIPMVSSDPPPENQAELNQKVFEILSPGIKKLRDLTKFKDRAIWVFAENIQRLAHLAQSPDKVHHASS